MNHKFTVFYFLILFGGSLFAQEKRDKVLFKFDGKPVYKSEFKRLFGKNINVKVTDQKASIEADIQLFIDYKLKLEEAKELQLDTVSSYRKEVAKYREQLVLPYLNDDSLIDSLVAEAYQRSLKEVKARHLLIKVPEGSSDTIQAYTKIDSLRNQILNGADFSVVAKKHSEDPSAKVNGGDLGYFSAFRMVYSFESAAFNTPKGAVSNIFRSRFGYHILQVDDIRDSKGEIEVAHIMIRDTTDTGKSTIDKVYTEILNGGVFGELSKKYSDDRRTASNGGKLSKFTMGALPPPFGEVSFSLSKENEYSKPFKTAYGWHIVRFIKLYPIASFEDSKKILLTKTKKDSRSKTLTNPVVSRLKKEYKISINEAVKDRFDGFEKGKVLDSINNWILVVEKDTLMQSDFRDFVDTKRNKKAISLFDNFVDASILNYYKENLEQSNQEFKNLFEEYRNGLLLFDLMQLKIWDAAQNDSIGLQKYFKEHLLKYRKPATYNSIVVSTKDKSIADSIFTFIKDADSFEDIQKDLNAKTSVLFKVGHFEKDATVYPIGVKLQENSTRKYEENGYHIIVRIEEMTSEKDQTFEQVKGEVVSDYQNFIQDNWMKSLRSKHKIKVYKRTVKKLKSEMELYSEKS